ncbi:MAG: hypothetical protein WBV94_09725 [Blastocatellia bacterium]
MGGTTEAYRWAVSLVKKEAAFGTQVPDADLTKWIEVKEAEFAKIEKQRRTNQQYVNGVRGYTNYQVHTKKGMIRRKFDLSTEIFSWLLHLQLGNLTTTGSADPYSHMDKHPPICNLYPASFSLIEGIVCSGLTGTQKLYKGAVVNKQEITINSKLEIDHTVELLTDGSETAKTSFSFPTTPEAVSYLLGGMVTLKLNAYDAGSDTDVSSQLQQLKISINSNLEPTKAVTNGVLVPRYKFKKDSPKMDIEATFSADKSDAIYGYYENETRLRLQMLIDPALTPLRTVNLDVPECFIDTCEQGADDIEPTLKLKIEGLDVIANTGPAIWVTKTGVAAYLTT